MRHIIRIVALAGAASLLAIGCKKTADNSINYKAALNGYYSAHPSCLWDAPKQFPVQVGAGDADKTAPYDALVDQGLLVRSSAEKKIIIISKRETNYDLSDKGRAAWTADTTQPGFGNFCYGHRDVSTIDSSTPNSGNVGDTTQVTYRYTFAGAPDWAKAPETQNAFPRVKTDLNAVGSATATLLDTSSGWQIKASSGQPATSADGKIVE